MSRLMLRLIISTALLGMMLFTRCDLLGSDDGSSYGDTGITPGAELMASGTYTTTTIGGKLAIITRVTSARSIDTIKYCNSFDSLVTQYDTSDTSTEIDTAIYEITNNTLHFFDGDTETFSSAVVEYYLILTRKGSGVGLPGIWQLTEQNYRVISGQLSTSDKDTVDKIIADENLFFDAMIAEIEITATTVKSFSKLNPARLTILMMERQVDQFDSCLSVTTTEVNQNSLRITGTKSGEQVTLTINPTTYDITYTSTKASHPAHTYYEKPTTCPNEDLPEWFNEFLFDNLKSSPGCLSVLAKRNAHAATSSIVRMQIQKVLLRLL